MNKFKFKQFKGGPTNLIILVGVLLFGLYALSQLADLTRSTKSINYTEFIKAVESGNVKDVHVSGSEVYGVLKDSSSSRFEVTIPANSPTIWDKLTANNVNVSVSNTVSSDYGYIGFIALLILLVSIGGIWYYIKQAKGAGGSGSNMFNLGKSKAKMFLPSQIKVNFNSVAGAVEAKEELFDVVDFLKNPDKYRRLGAKLTRGVLLVGDPGNGKTLLARAVAGEANCPFFSISGSDFIEVFVGVGAARVRDLFAQARKAEPCIIFIDEIDAVGRARGVGLGGGHDEREQTLNQLLTEMDGFDTANNSVVVMAATNRPDVLDKALLRPGRFDRRVNVPYPDVSSREEILKVHAKGVKLNSEVDLKKLARATPGFTGADLENMINEAAINAAKHSQENVTMFDFDEARDKMLLGKESKTVVLNEKERRMTAYHEAGHALVILLLPEVSDPLHKITIIPRGSALGLTFSLPEINKDYTQSRERIEASIKCCLGGRAAEELIFNNISNGAYSDFQKATQYVRSMVCLFGMSPLLGHVVYESEFDSGKFAYSQETARLIDEEVRRIMSDSYESTMVLLKENKDKLDKLALELLEKETLQASEVYELLGIMPREEHKLI